MAVSQKIISTRLARSALAFFATEAHALHALAKRLRALG
jgi:hypothetical protein